MGFAVSKFVFIPPQPSKYDLQTFPHNLIFIPVTKRIDGSTASAIPALYVHCEGAEHVLVYCHGNACDLGLIYPEVCLLAQSLKSHVIAIDYPGYGLHKGEPTEAGCYETLRQVLAYLQTKMKVSISRIILYGRSLGTAIVTRIASEMCKTSTPPSGVILQSPFTSIKTLVSDIVGTSFFMFSEMFDSKTAIKHVTCPLLVIHGLKDDLIPYKHGEKLYHLTSSIRKRIHLCPEADHNDFDYTGDVLAPIGNFMHTFCAFPEIPPQAMTMAASNPILAGFLRGQRVELPDELFHAPADVSRLSGTVEARGCSINLNPCDETVLRYPCLSHAGVAATGARGPSSGYRGAVHGDAEMSMSVNDSTADSVTRPLSVPTTFPRTQAAGSNGVGAFTLDATDPSLANAVVYENIFLSPRPDASRNARAVLLSTADPQARQDLRKAQSAEAAAIYVNSML